MTISLRTVKSEDEEFLFIVYDTVLLPEDCNYGIGQSLPNEILLEEAHTNSLPVTTQVERMNPALHFHERLGFRLLEDRGIHPLMEWAPKEMELSESAG